MMEVGRAISSMMKVYGATKSTLSNSVRLFNYVCGNRCNMAYFMMSRKLLHRKKEVCGATSRMMNKLIVGKHQVDRTRLFIVFDNKLFSNSVVLIYIILWVTFFSFFVCQ